MPFLSMGGSEALLSRVSRQLRQRGFRIVVVTTIPLMEDQGETTAWFEDSAEAIHHLPRTAAPERWLDFLLGLIREHSIDVLWQAGSTYIYEVLPEICRAFPSIAVIDLLFNTVGHTADFLRRQDLIDRVAAEHDGVKQWLAERGVPAGKIAVIPNGVDVREFAPAPKIAWRTGLPRGEARAPFVAGFVGRLSEEKGPDLFVDIAAEFANDEPVDFVVCGVGRMQEQLQATVAARGLSERVHFLGFLPARDALARCDAVIVSSRLDGRPNVVMESLAMGIPVVASRVGGIPDMLPAGPGAMLCDAGDAAAFARSIRALMDPERYREHSAAARRHAEAHFSIAETGLRYAELLEDAVRERAAAPRPRPEAPIPPPETAGSKAAGLVRLLAMLLSPAHVAGNCRNALLLWKLRRGGIDPAAQFDGAYYRAMYPDIARSGMPPFFHYVFRGFQEGRDPSARFDSRRYLAAHPDATRAGINPLLHSLRRSDAGGRGARTGYFGKQP